ncbi:MULTISPECIES: exodeoxyribonuclease VII small subunit [Corynebacterium]|uniref:Exodeoxyribonuclease 7 small subunit n=1 Tax=Corynebacterium lowii TaxID=1544413 RepID=A0A0Q0YGW4_9CORY|nr:MULTISPECIES: exodeoxyribonuclease VII small subunit [Corynebacterium]KQB85868.1 Exodeoxyribonuclease 7 small subunit [Corynebacterium lowii]MDK8451318.1 exodeoxyribonuclease VII small subunit [Corynebacterium mastitidis]MDP9850705.1 exodeoxyribonuclease VII small subunit [Corynebacterium lowii]
MSNPDTFGTGRAAELPEVSTLSYEQARNELVEVIKILELGQMDLDESLAYWERGEALAARCEQQLDRASAKVEAALAQRGSGGSADAAGSAPASPEEAERRG